MTCKDCIHYEVCFKLCTGIDMNLFMKDDNTTASESCTDFKDKSKFVKLPCKLNDLFYIIPTAYNGFDEITRVECLGFQISRPEPVADLFRKENGKSSRLYQAGFKRWGRKLCTKRTYILTGDKMPKIDITKIIYVCVD